MKKDVRLDVARMVLAAIMMVVLAACGGLAPAPKAPVGDPNAALVKGVCVQKSGEVRQAQADYIACLEEKQAFYAKVLDFKTRPSAEPPTDAQAPVASASASSIPPQTELNLDLMPHPEATPSPMIQTPGVAYPSPKFVEIVDGGPACLPPVHKALYVWNAAGSYGGATVWIVVRGEVQILPCDRHKHFMPVLVHFKGEAAPRVTWAIPPMGGMDGMEARLAFKAVGQVVVHFEAYEPKWMDSYGRMVLGTMIGKAIRSYSVPRLTDPYATTITSGMLTPWAG